MLECDRKHSRAYVDNIPVNNLLNLISKKSTFNLCAMDFWLSCMGIISSCLYIMLT